MSTPMRVCALCGKEYEGIGDTRYCPECTAEQRKNVMRIRICKDCGREFIQCVVKPLALAMGI